MNWDHLPLELRQKIWKHRFISMGMKKLNDILQTCEDLPFNPNANIDTITCINLQFNFYKYTDWNEVYRQISKFLNNM